LKLAKVNKNNDHHLAFLLKLGLGFFVYSL